MKRELTDKVRVSHVVEAIEEVEKYLKGHSYQDFLDNSKKRFATIKQIEIVGEACNRMSKGFRGRHSEIKSKEINGFRNISIHEYFGVDNQIVWQIAKDDLPALKKQFNKAIGDI